MDIDDDIEESPTLQQAEELLLKVQEARRQQQLLEDAGYLFDRAKRLLGDDATDQAKAIMEGTLVELTSERFIPVHDLIATRVKELSADAAKWKSSKSATKPLKKPPSYRELDSALALRPLHQDERVYAEIFAPQDHIKQSERADFEAVLHAPDRERLPVESCFALVAWPAGKPYNPGVATVLGQATRPETKEEVPSAESAEVTGGTQPPKPDSGATRLQVVVPQLRLSPGLYWLALAYNDVPLPGPRTALQVDSLPPAEKLEPAVPETRQPPSWRRLLSDAWSLLLRMGPILTLINMAALVLLAWWLYSQLAHLAPIATPTPVTTIPTVAPAVPTPAATGTKSPETVMPTASPIPTSPPVPPATLLPPLSQLITVTLAVTEPMPGPVLTLVGKPITITVVSLATTAQLPSGNLLLMDGITTVQSLTATFQLSAKPQLFPVTFHKATQYTQLAVAWQSTVTLDSQPSDVVQLPSLTIVSNEAIVTATTGIIRSRWVTDTETIIATVPMSTSVRLIGIGHDLTKGEIWLRVTVPKDTQGISIKKEVRGDLIEGWIYANRLKYDQTALALLPELPENVPSASQ